MYFKTLLLFLALLSSCSITQKIERRVGSLTEVFAWRQLTYDINGRVIIQDRFGAVEDDATEEVRTKRQSSGVFFNNNDDGNQNRHQRPSSQPQTNRPSWSSNANGGRPTSQPSSNGQNTDDSSKFFIQYNNVPMGVERVKRRLFVTVPRRRYGIPSTLNYIDLARDSNTRSPALRPYPDFRSSQQFISIYRTRADSCERLWAVDTGMLEIPNNRQQLKPPAIVIIDLKTNKLIRRYNFKSDDLPSANTPAGLASITVDITGDACDDAYAYIPDLATFGLIIYSYKDNDSWRVTHNFMHFNPIAGRLRIAGQSFQWSDGIFSITLSPPNRSGCKQAYFHPMVSTNEFSVSTCTLKNRTDSSSSDYWNRYSVVGERGVNSQSTMHGYHAETGVMFFAEVGRDAISCWNSALPLDSSNVAIVAQDNRLISYPSDLHVTGDEVWVMVNSMPRFIYSRLDTNEYNFFIYRGSVQDMIANSTCAQGLSLTSAVSFVNS